MSIASPFLGMDEHQRAGPRRDAHDLEQRRVVDHQPAL